MMMLTTAQWWNSTARLKEFELSHGLSHGKGLQNFDSDFAKPCIEQIGTNGKVT